MMVPQIEAKTMAKFLAAAVSTDLCDNDAVANNSEWMKLAEQACEILDTLARALEEELPE